MKQGREISTIICIFFSFLFEKDISFTAILESLKYGALFITIGSQKGRFFITGCNIFNDSNKILKYIFFKHKNYYIPFSDSNLQQLSERCSTITRIDKKNQYLK